MFFLIEVMCVFPPKNKLNLYVYFPLKTSLIRQDNFMIKYNQSEQKR